MKRVTCLFIALVVGIFAAYAAPVAAASAQKVATNFFSQMSSVQITQVKLAYTETDPSDNAVFYVFNINSNDGFVIVSADDAQRPIIGYSTEKRPYAIPKSGTNIDFWMQKRKTEIISNVANGVQATQDISNEWAAYTNNTLLNTPNNTNRVMGGPVFPSSTTYLVQSQWNQPSPYNDDCPGTGSSQAVTGCVATAMCQIMRYWQYPATGQGTSYYYTNTDNYYNEYLYANYAHAYAWSAMPLTNPSVADTNLARAMSDAGISVQMEYTPTESGAYVLSQDNPYASAQNSYVQYFKYSAHILDGEYEYGNSTRWQDTIEKEINNSRPVQYAGYDPAPNTGGHTWVCDGYDINNNFHMNWGWSGQDDGWYALNNLNPAGYNFSNGEEALIGIMPPQATSKPKTYFTSSAVMGCTNNSIQYMDTSSNQPTSWNWTFTGGTPATSTLQNPLVSYSTAGNYAAKLVVGNSFGKDSLTVNNYVTVNTAPGVPVIAQNGSTLQVTPSNYPQYSWTRNNVSIDGQNSSQLPLSKIGLYIVTVTDANGCTNTSAQFEVTAVLGVNNLSVEDNISVYPNPTSGNIKVDLNIPQEGDYTLSVSNILGQTLYTSNINLSGPYTGNINMASYGKGMYFLSIKGEQTNFIKKVIVY